uniref:Maltogenic amylase-like C-terminal domain-containing protein n=1 Tax=Ralstonia solanacearum TaxID=305 RepID=A0A0S4U1G6_RALSL|nr:protein of unknown function [Ralstonia solanacearum]
MLAYIRALEGQSHDHPPILCVANLSRASQAVELDLSGYAPVSYTHLRAHETRGNLVCRLLLEKKKR